MRFPLQVKSVDVVRAYIARIEEVQGLLNAVIDNRFEDALQEALRADQLVSAGTKTVGELAAEKPLLGIPFTTKNSVGVKGDVFLMSLPQRSAPT